jgi:serine phosphatase RsbU (regulator of sigma subunit)
VKRCPIFILLVLTVLAQAQSGWNKSKLLAALSDTRLHDTTRINVYNELCWPVYSYTNADSSLYYGTLALELSANKRDMLKYSVAHRRIGITYLNTGDLRKALFHEERSYNLSDSLKFERGKFLATNNIGVAYLNSEMLDKALPYFLKTLPYLEKEKLFPDLVKVYTNCGIINRKLQNVPKEKYYFINANKVAILSGDSDLVALSNTYLCATYRRLQNFDSANYYLKQAGNFISSFTAQHIVFSYYLTAAQIQSQTAHHREALLLFEKAQPYCSSLSDEITLLINFGEQYVHLKEYAKALAYYRSALEKSERSKMYDNLQFVSAAMAGIYEKQNNIPAYARTMKAYVQYRDSNEKINQAQEILSKQLQFDLERQHVADSIRFEQKEQLTTMELEVAEARLQRERITRLMLVGGLVVLIGIAFFILQRLRITNRQKHIIELQKKIVETKNTELMDSINYARRLQLAILPQLSDIRQHLDVHLFYQPKDIIGGDFYFFDHYQGRLFLAICDCTGHGVPGAIMSVVCHEALSKSIREHGLLDPAEILQKSRAQIIHSLNAEEQKIRDGMDCSILVIDRSTRIAKWAGANHPLWFWRNNTFNEIKGTKQSVSYHEQTKDFVTEEFALPHDITMYLFTDGYADQFGGPKNKKYMYRTLKQQLQKMHSLSGTDQVAQLSSEFLRWKGASEQIDDVTVAIIRL